MPPRLYYWLALGGTGTAIGVSLINHWDRLALGAFLAAFVFVLMGGLFELLIPALVWRFGRFGKFDRALQARIKLGESLLKQPVVSHDEAQHWDALTQQVLRKYIGGEWHQEFRRYDNFEV